MFIQCLLLCYCSALVAAKEEDASGEECEISGLDCRQSQRTKKEMYWLQDGISDLVVTETPEPPMVSYVLSLKISVLMYKVGILVVSLKGR